MTSLISMIPTDFQPCSDILLGNSFPLSLIRRPVAIEPFPAETLQERLQEAVLHSFWGHGNTLKAASQWLGEDLTPKTERPVILLSSEGLPQLDELVFRECFILSPDYRSGFRPAIGVEVAPEDILAWTVLKIEWKISADETAEKGK